MAAANPASTKPWQDRLAALLHPMRRERRDAGIPTERRVYLNLEDEQLAGIGMEHLRILPEEYYRRYPGLRQRQTVTRCLDEIQVVPGGERFVRHLLGNAGALCSVEKFFADLKSQELRVSKDTVRELLAHVEDCFLARILWIEAGSERRRMVNPRKIDPVDRGLRPVFDRTGCAYLGHALETAVMLDLERRRCDVNDVHTASSREVDFLARAGGGLADVPESPGSPS